jgi:hypothetical protein
MAKVIAKHPEIQQMMDTTSSKAKILKNLKYGSVLGIPGLSGLAGVGYLLRNILSPNMSNPYDGNNGGQ